MTLLEFTGCALTAFGPALSMFIVTIMNDPVRVIILIASSFFWLLSLLFSSIIWFVFPSNQHVWFGVLVSVLVQELFRYFLYLLLRKAERGLKRFVVHSFVSNKHMLSYVSGLGFGVMSGLFALINILAEVGGPGTMGLRGGYSAFCIVSSIFTAFIIFLHIFLEILFFHGLNTDNKNFILYVVISHLVVSEITLLNQYYFNTLALCIVFIITLSSGYYAFKTAGGHLPIIDRFKNQNTTTEAEN